MCAEPDSQSNPATKLLDDNFGKRIVHQVRVNVKISKKAVRCKMCHLYRMLTINRVQEPVQWDNLRPRPVRALGAGRPLNETKGILETADPRYKAALA